MKWQVTGTSKSNGARMVLELEAGSKADAERKAKNQGMNVTKALMLEGDAVGTTGVTTRVAPAKNRQYSSRIGAMVRMAIWLVLLIGAAWFTWPYIHSMITELRTGGAEAIDRQP